MTIETQIFTEHMVIHGKDYISQQPSWTECDPITNLPLIIGTHALHPETTGMSVVEQVGFIAHCSKK